jgi:hypothetical protein
MNINNTTDLILAVARALEDRDMSIIEKAFNANNDWLQSREEFEAQDLLICAAQDAIEELEA